MKIRHLKVSAVLLAATLLTSSCVGSFSLFNKLAGWNKEATGNKFLNELIFILISPAYAVCTVADVLVLNTIEFWTGSNPVAQRVGTTQEITGKDGKLYGTPAVIDKDFASECMAEQLDADMLIILTAVEKVAINYNKPDQKGLDDLTPAEAYKYMEENQFAKGSMLPKVQAAVKFAESKAGRTALITLLEKAKDGIEGKTGTRIHQ